MSAPKFKKGDRVRFVGNLKPGDISIGIRIGDTATVLEDDQEPWIRLDRLGMTGCDAEGRCEKGHGWVGYDDQLELIPPDPMASISAHPAINETADDVLIAAWAKSALDGLPKLPLLRTSEAEARFVAAFAGVRRALEALVP